jgi:hypothetical protein
MSYYLFKDHDADSNNDKDDFMNTVKGTASSHVMDAEDLIDNNNNNNNINNNNNHNNINKDNNKDNINNNNEENNDNNNNEEDEEIEHYDEEELLLTANRLALGSCVYDGKTYMSAQQIPRNNSCDFCFCFRSDIICLQVIMKYNNHT